MAYSSEHSERQFVDCSNKIVDLQCFIKIKLRMENTVDNKSVDENNKPGVTSLTNHTFYVL